MKKGLLLCFFFSFLSISLFAEKLNFITVLSSPVGAFNKLETVDPSTAAQGSTVNFCTSLGNEGSVELRGANNASLGNVNLSPNTTLGRTTSSGDYVLSNIVLKQGGSVTGGRLLSNVINISGSAVGKSDNLYSGNTFTVAGAKTTGLNVGNESIMEGTGSASEMVWSNEYQTDTACKEGTSYEKCQKQYLLKAAGSSSSGCSNRPAELTQSDSCGSGMTGIKTRQWIDEPTCDWGPWDTSACQTKKLRCLKPYCLGLHVASSVSGAPSSSMNSASATCENIKNKTVLPSWESVSLWDNSLKERLTTQNLYDIASVGCTLGGECEACTPGRVYYRTQGVGVLCSGVHPGTLYLLSSGMCMEADEESALSACSHAKSCSSWSDVEMSRNFY